MRKILPQEYDDVESELLDLASKNENISRLTKRENAELEEGFEKVYHRGYLDTLQLLIDYKHPAANITAKDFFEAATKLLPEDRLAHLLAKHCLL